jgi:hypothetical protein
MEEVVGVSEVVVVLEEEAEEAAFMEMVEADEVACIAGTDKVVVEGLDTVPADDSKEVAVCRPGA